MVQGQEQGQAQPLRSFRQGDLRQAACRHPQGSSDHPAHCLRKTEGECVAGASGHPLPQGPRPDQDCRRAPPLPVHLHQKHQCLKVDVSSREQLLCDLPRRSLDSRWFRPVHTRMHASVGLSVDVRLRGEQGSRV
uniref:R1 protein n=1 Tax=Toxoplasma gondii TaxID=5811 RepID=Q8I7T1_TOXGO|nr:R1 protein [Toxoplasma gondii]